MASNTSSAYTISLFLTLAGSMLIHSPPCLARFPPETKSLDQKTQNHEPQAFDLVSPLQPCLAAVANAGGCVGEISRFSSGLDTKLKDVCCKSMIQIDDDCWATILPVQPFFPSMMKSYCTTRLRGAPGGLPSGGPGGVVGLPGGAAGGVVGAGPGGVVGAGGGALPTPP